MIVCKECGFRNPESETFCGSCGRFLEWFGQDLPAAAGRSRASDANDRAIDRASGTEDAVSRTPAAPSVRTAPAEAPRLALPGDDDVICRSCGTVSRATRRFCRSCGAELAPAPHHVNVVASPPSTAGPSGLRAKLTAWRRPPAS